jgi:hypothetical protein
VTSTPFAQFGDSAQYTLAPGGSFESGAPGWSLSRASVVEGNESYNLVPGTHSLAIGSGGQAVSPWVCISSEYPTFRLMAKRVGGSGLLNVSLQYVNVLGLGVNLSVANLESDPSWAPSPAMRLGNSLPLWLPGTSLQIRLVFQPGGTSSWSIDDVFLDPYSRR